MAQEQRSQIDKLDKSIKECKDQLAALSSTSYFYYEVKRKLERNTGLRQQLLATYKERS